MRYRRKPLVFEATQWFKKGDHPKDNCETFIATGDLDMKKGTEFLGEGKVVRYYRHPSINGQERCRHCGIIMHDHGWIDTLEGGHTVCPGDWILTGVNGEYWPVKPDVFKKTYEPDEPYVDTKT